jgi:predicted nucleic acid-binding protein
MVERDHADVFASNQVIGETYIALQHHYGVSKADARASLVSVLTSGLVAPLNGAGVLDEMEARGGCGLLDRLIANDYRSAGLDTLTLDRRMAALPQARRI